jgi:hypothetical protein
MLVRDAGEYLAPKKNRTRASVNEDGAAVCYKIAYRNERLIWPKRPIWRSIPDLLGTSFDLS